MKTLLEAMAQGPLVMGILNVTPDSFFDGGNYQSEISIRTRLDQMVEAGVDIIDLGAYSTRPGAADVSPKEEISRLLPAVELIRRYHPNILLSIDTFRSEVAREVNECMGPIIVNDISGGTLDENMFTYVAESNLDYILMHIKGTPQNMQNDPQYEDVVTEVKSFFRMQTKQLIDLGHDKIVLDPGFGFAKTVKHNYELLDRMQELKELNLPLLVGVSRKSMIYRPLDVTPLEALNGTTALHMAALINGAQILRVHDVKEAVETVKLFKLLKTK